MNIAPMFDCLAWISNVLVLSPNGEDGSKKSGKPGAKGRSVLKTVNADNEPKILSWLLPSIMETVNPSLLGAVGLLGKQSTAISAGMVSSIGSAAWGNGVEKLLDKVSLELMVSDCANPPFASNTNQADTRPRKWNPFRTSTEPPSTWSS